MLVRRRRWLVADEGIVVVVDVAGWGGRRCRGNA